MQRLALCAFLVVATIARAQLPSSSASRVGFDPARFEVLHATTKRFVDEGKHSGLITLPARDGAATTYCQIDPKEKLVAIAFAQHFPYNQHHFFSKFTTGYFQALK